MCQANRFNHRPVGASLHRLTMTELGSLSESRNLLFGPNVLPAIVYFMQTLSLNNQVTLHLQHKVMLQKQDTACIDYIRNTPIPHPPNHPSAQKVTSLVSYQNSLQKRKQSKRTLLPIFQHLPADSDTTSCLFPTSVKSPAKVIQYLILPILRSHRQLRRGHSVHTKTQPHTHPCSYHTLKPLNTHSNQWSHYSTPHTRYHRPIRSRTPSSLQKHGSLPHLFTS